MPPRNLRWRGSEFHKLRLVGCMIFRSIQVSGYEIAASFSGVESRDAWHPGSHSNATNANVGFVAKMLSLPLNTEEDCIFDCLISGSFVLKVLV